MAVGQIHQQIAQVVDTLAILVVETQHEGKSFLALKHFSGIASGKGCTDILVELLHVEPILGQTLPVVFHRDLRQSRRALHGYILGSGNLGDHML